MRATTLTPRSWPSSPTLATNTRPAAIGFGEAVHADHDPLAGVERPLVGVGGVGDLTLEPVLLDAVDGAVEHRALPHLLDAIEDGARLALDLVGELLDQGRAAQGVG